MHNPEMRSAQGSPAASDDRMPRWTYPLFFASGAAALIYQVVWQRSLFAIYGINVEAVTVVVTAFMLGLGLGSAVGGWVSARHPRQLLMLFGVVELAIGAYGLVSLPLLKVVGEATAQLPGPAIAGSTFALILLPTVLMGSTLPMLVAFLVGRSSNVGEAVGGLYFVNTLGSAFASMATVLVLLGALGQSGAVYCAVALNALVALWVLGVKVTRGES